MTHGYQLWTITRGDQKVEIKKVDDDYVIYINGEARHSRKNFADAIETALDKWDE